MGKKHVDKTSASRSKRQKLTDTEFWKEKGRRLWNYRCHGKPDDYSTNDTRRITVVCEKCGKKIQKRVDVWVSGKTLCLDCARAVAEEKREAEARSKREAPFARDGAESHPTFWNTYPMFVLRYWDWKRNERMPWEVGNSSASIVHAKCPVCGKTYSLKASSVWRGLKSKAGIARCSDCGHRRLEVGAERGRINTSRNLAEARPDVVAHWAWEENGELRPDQFTVGSAEVVFWVYDNGEVVKRQIRCRTNAAQPDWSRPRKYYPGRGRGKTVADYPELVEEFDDRNEGSPEDYSYGSARRVLWRCKRCSYQWDSQVKSRTILESGCPRCAQSGVSTGEAHVRKALELLCLDYRTEHRFKDCRYLAPLPFDFVIFLPGTQKVFLAIEFQGRQHYEEIEIWGGKEGYEKRQLCDQIKRDWCEEHGVRLLEIPHTVDNFMDVAQTICRAL